MDFFWGSGVDGNDHDDDYNDGYDDDDVTMMTTVMVSAVAGCGQALSPNLADANP